MIRIAPLAAILLFCTACAGSENAAVRNDPNFQAGYSSGCSAATTEGADYRAGPSRDEELYQNDEAYRRGWGSGYASCRRTLSSPNSAPGSNPIRDPSPGH